jgi:hypothetical protein
MNTEKRIEEAFIYIRDTSKWLKRDSETYKKEVKKELKALVEEVFEDILTEFGYYKHDWYIDVDSDEIQEIIEKFNIKVKAT